MKAFGWILRIAGYLLTVAVFTVPTAILAYHFSGSGHPPSEFIMALLMSVIAVFVAACVPVAKFRALWGAVFGGIAYCALAYVCLFGFARLTAETTPLLTPFGVGGGSRFNAILLYAGAGVLALAVALAALGRMLLRRFETAHAQTAPLVQPTVVPDERAVPAWQSAAPASQQAPAPASTPIAMPDSTAAQRYVRDGKGNLIARRVVTPPRDTDPRR